MKILIANDDGYHFEGIQILFEVLSREHDVVMVAPDTERSGYSHAITLGRDVTFTKVSDKKYLCSGTPADCVLYSILGAIDFVPDLVIGGINRGPNLGSDLLYSGTAAVARQAALYHYPSIAVSCHRHQPPFQYELEANLLLEKIPYLLTKITQNTFININFPEKLTKETQWIESSLANRKYEDYIKLKCEQEGSNCKSFVIYGEPIDTADDQPTSDWHAVKGEKIAYSVVKLEL